jgi:hypothetical protein
MPKYTESAPAFSPAIIDSHDPAGAITSISFILFICNAFFGKVAKIRISVGFLHLSNSNSFLQGCKRNLNRMVIDGKISPSLNRIKKAYAIL